MSPEAEREVRRLVTRMSIERVAAGFTTWDLGKHCAVKRQNIDKVERGEVLPSLAFLVEVGLALGLRLDFLPAHLLPLLDLDEFQVQALLAGAAEGYRHVDPASDVGRMLHSTMEVLRL